LLRPDIALFIDSDNFPAKSIAQVVDQLLADWNVPVRKAFGAGLVPKTNTILRAAGVEPIEVLPNLPGKNCTDFALVASLMAELFHRRVHGFAIASGDSDFTAAVHVIRSLGLPVIVYGPENTPLCLQKAGSQFRSIRTSNAPNIHQQTLVQQPSLCGPGQLRDWLIDSFEEFAKSPGGPLTLARFGQLLRRRDPHFTAQRYGLGSTSALLRKTGGFQLKELRNKSGTLIDYTLALTTHRLSVVDSGFNVAEGRKLMAISA
jgi:hypothetical protein